MSVETGMAAAVVSLNDGRVFFGMLPREVVDAGQWPAVAYYIVDDVAEVNQQSYVRNPRYRFDVWSNKYEDTVETGQSIIDAIDHVRFGTFVASFQGARDLVDLDTRLFHRVMDFSVWGN